MTAAAHTSRVPRVVARSVGGALAVLAVLAVALLALPAAAQNLLQAEVAIESQEVFVGQPIVFQITVTGDKQPEPPNLAAAAQDFTVEYLGPRSNSSTQISIVNGRVNKVDTHQTILTYRLTPKRAGQLIVPRLTVTAGGQQAVTQPVPVRVRPPDAAVAAVAGATTLRMDLSRDTVCVGEPIMINWTWTIGAEVRAFEFQLPVFEMQGLEFPKIEAVLDPQLRDRYIGIRLPDGRQVVALQTPRRTPTGNATDVTFSQVVIPRQAGIFALPKSTVICDVLAAVQQPRRRSADPFADLLGQRDRTYQRITVPSNEPRLTVLALPEEGKPTGFAGHVGKYELRVTAEPTDVSVGDPITLTVSLSGPDYMEKVDGPDLDSNAELARNFRISPAEPGIVDGRTKVFKRVLRAKDPEVTQIPPISLPYYDTATRSYQVAQSAAIPLTVKAVKLVTAMDAEGSSAPVTETGRKLQAWSRGIAANYEDLGALADQHVGLDAALRSPRRAGVLVLPPALYVLTLLVQTGRRRRHADPAARRARQALAQARRQLKATHRAGEDGHAQVLDALRQYFGAKLALTSGALVFRDLEAPLRERGLSEADLAAVKDLFATCEHGRYAGGSLGQGALAEADLATSARRLLDAIDGRISRA